MIVKFPTSWQRFYFVLPNAISSSTLNRDTVHLELNGSEVMTTCNHWELGLAKVSRKY